MLVERVLDLARADLVAAALDQVRRAPPHDPDVAVRGARGHVAGREPAVAHRLRRRVRPVEVLEEQVRPADLDLAHGLVVGDVELVAGVVDQPHGHAVHGKPDRPRPAIAVGADRRVHQRLAHPVALDRLQPARGRDARVVRGRQARPTRTPAAGPHPPRPPATRTPRGPRRAGGTSSARRRASSRARPAPRPPPRRRSARDATRRRRAAAARARPGSARARETAAARARRRPRPSSPTRRPARRGSRRSPAAAARTPFGGPVVPDV